MSDGEGLVALLMRAPARSRTSRVLGVALTVVAVHLLVLAFLTLDGAAALGTLAWLALCPLLLLAFDRGNRVTRVLATGVPGLGVTAAGLITHAGRTAMNGPSATDVTGIAMALAGLALLVIAGRELFRGTRRVTKLLWVPLALVVLQFYVGPVLVMGIVGTNAPRPAGPPAASLGLPGAEDVRFSAVDGVSLRGWYVPGRGDAAVIVLHGSHGTRDSTKDYLRFLAAAGYAVLAYDARGHGASGGHENALGWNGDRDVAGAIAYLHGRGIDRIAALGLSMGGEEALRSAGEGSGLRAVVADGAGRGTLGDAKLESDTGSPLFTAVTWLGMRTVELFSKDTEPRPLADVVEGVRVPVLLIASSRRNERRIGTIFRGRIGARATLWHVADADHTQALAKHPRQYRQRVLGFLSGALR